MKKIPIRKLGAPQQSMRPEEFKIRKVEDILPGSDLIQDLHRHDFFFMLALQKGAGRHEIDFTSYQVGDNSVFFLRPGQVHQLELRVGSSGYLIEFNPEFYHPDDKTSYQRLRKASNKNYCALEINRFKKICASLNLIYHEYTAKEEGYRDVIRHSLSILFIDLGRQSPNGQRTARDANSYTQERFEEFLDLLEKRISTNKQVSQYANLMSLSPYQLNEITRSSVGKTASELINEHIVLEAKRYLLATPNQVKDIADHLGYEDTSYFIRFFRKQTGYSPEAFRNSPA
jgi:AraC-like DNA-binding protein